MRRFGRILLKAATVLSLVLGVTVAALWVRSYWHFETAVLDFGISRLLVSSLCGAVDVSWGPDANGPDAGFRLIEHDLSPFAGEWRRNLLLFYAYPEAYRPPAANFRIGLPHWAVLAACLILPATRFVRRRRRRRRDARGLCRACGYDLRATPERCPEYGVVPERGTSPRAPAWGRR